MTSDAMIFIFKLVGHEIELNDKLFDNTKQKCILYGINIMRSFTIYENKLNCKICLPMFSKSY